MSKLVWTPQRAFADYFNTTPKDIIKYRSIFTQGIEFFVSDGGRGSGKTFTWADAVVVEASIRPVRVLVTREFQNSIEESVKDEIESAITARGLDHFFNCQKTSIAGLNGSKFIFKGIRNNIKSLKSISNVDIVLCEEAEGITKDSWEKLLPSIRPKSGKPPIFIIIFNPDNELDDTYQRFVVNPPPNTLQRTINWRDNKYFPKHLNNQRLHAQKTMPPKDYRHVWEGEPKGSGDDVIIDLAWIKAARFASRKEGFEQVGPNVSSYDPAGQGRDFNAKLSKKGNIVVSPDEWLKSDDLRMATRRAMLGAQADDAEIFRYDECGGFGDGVSVFADDAAYDDGDGNSRHIDKDNNLPYPTINVGKVIPFNAGDSVVNPEDEIIGTAKTAEEVYTNAKAQAHGVSAQLLYNTYRFVVLDEEVDPLDMISIDIEDDQVFNKIARELSTPIWVKSGVNSKKKVESKKDMEKRTGLASPNYGDSFHMLNAPIERDERGFLDVWMDKKKAEREGKSYSTHKTRAKRTGSRARKKESSGLGGFYSG